MSELVFASYLGPNTTEPAEALAGVLARALDVPVRHVTAPPDDRADLTWACGLLTVQRIDTGRLAADIVAAPVFPGETSPVYRSVIVTRRGAPPPGPATVYAINQVDSWSGHHALLTHLGRPIRSVETGSHVASIAAVRGGSADAAAIDSSVWDHVVAEDPEVADALVVVDRTVDWPAPPFALARRLDDAMRDRMTAALLAAAVPGLIAIVPARGRDYDPIRAASARAVT